MARFVELVDANPTGTQRFRKASDGRSLGVEHDRDGVPLIWIYVDGQPDRVLSRREIHTLLIDTDNDWSIANR